MRFFITELPILPVSADAPITATAFGWKIRLIAATISVWFGRCHCVGGDLLMADVDDLDAFVDAAVVNVDDVAAAELEDGVDPFRFQGLGDEPAAGDDIGIGAFAGERVVGGAADDF